jgi:hypothetical protein
MCEISLLKAIASHAQYPMIILNYLLMFSNITFKTSVTLPVATNYKYCYFVP